MAKSKGEQTHNSDKRFDERVDAEAKKDSTEHVGEHNKVGNNSLDAVTNDSSAEGRGWFGKIKSKKENKEDIDKNKEDSEKKEE